MAENQNHHISEFLYKFGVNEDGHIPCTIKVDGIERTFEITERDFRNFAHIFEMNKHQLK